MSDNGDIREDLRVPENEVGKEIESKFEAGEEFMVSVKDQGSDLWHKCFKIWFSRVVKTHLS